MPATVTLSSTTLSENVSATSSIVKVASTSGLLPNVRLFVEGELMRVVSLGVGTGEVNVLRGQDATKANAHDAGETVYVCEAHQLYHTDPQGVPEAAIAVSPYINLNNGSIWFAQGGPTGTAKRWWQKQSVTYGTGPLGIRTVTYDPTSSF